MLVMKKQYPMENEADIQFQIDILRRDGYHAAARIIESMQDTVSRKAEMEYLKTFVEQGGFDTGQGRGQLRCLWTAYCFHHGLDADTAGYDHDLRRLWDIITESKPGAAEWRNYDCFDNFMCKYLV